MSDYNEYLDEESQEYSYQQFKETMDGQVKHLNRYQAEQSQKAAATDQQNIFNDALKEVGISNDQFKELVSKDPQGTRETFVNHVKSYVSNVARNRDPQTGQFVSGKPKAQQYESGKSVQQRREQRQQAGPTTAELRARAEKGETISEDDVMRAAFPDSLF